ncbi:hypothetical protein D3C74_296600 [compost metagenome]
MLARAGLCDDFLLPHPLSQDPLPDRIVDLVSAGMVQILAFQVNFGPAQVLRQAFCIIQRGLPPGILLQQISNLRLKLGIIFIFQIGFFQFD